MRPTTDEKDCDWACGSCSGRTTGESSRQLLSEEERSGLAISKSGLTQLIHDSRLHPDHHLIVEAKIRLAALCVEDRPADALHFNEEALGAYSREVPPFYTIYILCDKLRCLEFLYWSQRKAEFKGEGLQVLQRLCELSTAAYGNDHPYTRRYREWQTRFGSIYVDVVSLGL